MGLKLVRTIILVLSLGAAATAAIGQGCSSAIELGQKASELSSSGNGGGYGGMTSTSGGPYSSATPSAAPSSTPTNSPPSSPITPYFYLIGAGAPCSPYPAGWEAVGPAIASAISLQGSAYLYAASLCAPSPAPIDAATVSIADFDPYIAIYQNQVFRHFDGLPPAAPDLVMQAAYCRETTPGPAGAELGLDVDIYAAASGQLYGEIHEGKLVAGQPTQFVVGAFAVAQAETPQQKSFTAAASGFSLQANRGGGLANPGALQALLDGQQLSLSMSCWLATP